MVTHKSKFYVLSKEINFVVVDVVVETGLIRCRGVDERDPWPVQGLVVKRPDHLQRVDEPLGPLRLLVESWLLSNAGQQKVPLVS